MELLRLVCTPNYDIEKIARMCAKHSTNVNIRDGVNNTPLYAASLLGHSDIASVLLCYGAISKRWCTIFGPIHIACLNKHYNVVEVLLNSGADVNDTDHNGKTALHYIVENGDEYTAGNSILSMLFEHNADPNIKDTFGKTPLDYAVEEGNKSIVTVLVDYMKKV